MIKEIEEFIHIMALGVCPINHRDAGIMESFDNQISKQLGLTEKQRNLALRIIKNNASSLSSFCDRPISDILENPVFRLPLRILKNTKKISIIDHVVHGRVIQIEFPFDEEKIKKIREQKEQINLVTWESDKSAWILSLEEAAIRFLINVIGEEDYDLDEEFFDYLTQAKNILENIEQYVPMLVLNQDGPKIANSPKNLPILTSKDVVSAVFEARRLGILTWDESIAQHITIFHLPESIKEFLTNDYDHVTLIDSQKNSINCLDTIVKYLSPCLIIIPGGSELEKTSMAYDYLKSQGIKNSEISAMFRLPSDTGADFNNFVKNSELNNPITDSTRIVFVSTKLPKSVLKSKIRFNSIINMGTHSAHHTIREFMKNHENLVIFSEISKLKNIRERLTWRLQGL
jgi:hypothetical protein